MTVESEDVRKDWLAGGHEAAIQQRDEVGKDGTCAARVVRVGHDAVPRDLKSENRHNDIRESVNFPTLRSWVSPNRESWRQRSPGGGCDCMLQRLVSW